MDLSVIAFVVIAGMTVRRGDIGARDQGDNPLRLRSRLLLHGVAITFIFLNAEYLGLIQVLVYVGAINVLILFGVMLTKRRLIGGGSCE